MKPTRVVLADDDNLVRAGIRALLENLAGIDVIGEASDGQAALRLCGELQPDIVFLDISMPRLNGLEVAARVTRECPQTSIIMLSMHVDAKYVQRALHAGVLGYLPKHSDLSELEMAITAVRQGQVYISPTIPETALVAYNDQTDGNSDLLQTLTERQREILQLIAEGHTTRDIANILSISVKTVETHRAHLMARLNIYDVPGLVKLAVRVGLVILQRDAEAAHAKNDELSTRPSTGDAL